MRKLEILASFSGFDDFLLYFAISSALLATFLAIYARITPYHELTLIREGNMAASFSLSGTLIGMVIPLANAVKFSVNPVDMAIWGFIALAVQLTVYMIMRIAVPNIAVAIPEGKQSAGFFLGIISIAAGVLSAACMSY